MTTPDFASMTEEQLDRYRDDLRLKIYNLVWVSHPEHPRLQHITANLASQREKIVLLEREVARRVRQRAEEHKEIAAAEKRGKKK